MRVRVVFSGRCTYARSMFCVTLPKGRLMLKKDGKKKASHFKAVKKRQDLGRTGTDRTQDLQSDSDE